MGRAERERRKSQARFRDLVDRWGAETGPRPPTPTPGNRPEIADQEVLGSPRVALVKCRPCGQPLKGIRIMKDERLVFGMPWVEIHAEGTGVFPLRCRECGTSSTVREAELARAAFDGSATGNVVSIPVGRKPLK